jgi:cytochrome c553
VHSAVLFELVDIVTTMLSGHRFVSRLLVISTAFAYWAVSGQTPDDKQSPDLPVWAYGTDPVAAKAGVRETKPDNSVKHLPGSEGAFTLAQIGARFGPADWFPGDHPSMPPIVADGRKPDVWACSLCHYPNGKGRPENAGVSGLPKSYFIAQMNEFRDGQRHSADPRKRNTGLMIAYAKAMTDEEIKQAAEYFGSMQWTPWIRVVETRTVPKMMTSVGMYLPVSGAGKEPLGNRIIETPIDPEGTEALRNPRSGFIAYVPVGSVARGKSLALSGTKGVLACGGCHGETLKGMGPVPGIAGRSPSYLVRQLYDMKQGTRNGEWTELMKPIVSHMTTNDMLNVAAYVSSLAP